MAVTHRQLSSNDQERTGSVCLVSSQSKRAYLSTSQELLDRDASRNFFRSTTLLLDTNQPTNRGELETKHNAWINGWCSNSGRFPIGLIRSLLSPYLCSICLLLVPLVWWRY